MLVQVACPKDENKTNKHNKQKKGGGKLWPKDKHTKRTNSRQKTKM